MFLSWLKPSLKFSRHETPLSDKSLIENLLNFSCRLTSLMMSMRRKSRFACTVLSFIPLFQPPLFINKSHKRRSDKDDSQARNILCYGISKYLFLLLC